MIFTDLVSRAVHIEAVYGYDTSSFLLALSRFANLRGYPSDMFSDPGSQLAGADSELKSAWKNMDQDKIKYVGAEMGMTWHFGPADASWYQGAVESLIAGVKRTFKIIMSKELRFSVSEFLTMCTEVANILNERPLGTLSGADSEVNILTPNCLLIGRATSKKTIAWQPCNNVQNRYAYVQQATAQFWKHWIEKYAPTMVWHKKWHASSQNLQVGDVVVVADSDSYKGDYHLGRIVEVHPGEDKRVRRVSLAYKNYKVGEKTYEYKGCKDTVVSRSVHCLALLVQMELMHNSEN